MKSIYKDYGCTATIVSQPGGFRLTVKDQNGKKVKDSSHKSKAAAYSAWRRFCS